MHATVRRAYDPCVFKGKEEKKLAAFGNMFERKPDTSSVGKGWKQCGELPSFGNHAVTVLF